MNLVDFIGQFLYPNRCIFCGVKCSDKSYKCENCSTPETPVVRMINIRPGVRGVHHHILKVISPAVYTGYYRKTLHYFKFGRKSYFAKKYAMLIDEMNLFNKGSDFITYVPMTKEKIRERGYNQAEVLARRISEISGVPVRDVIIKEKDNRIQHTLNMKERKENVKGMFAVNERLKGCHIILVDDIITTGATMTECARLLYRKGAASVLGICAADAQTREINKRKLKYIKIGEKK